MLRKVERRLAVVVALGGAGARSDELTRHAGLPIVRREHQRAPPELVGAVRGHAMKEQQPHDLIKVRSLAQRQAQGAEVLVVALPDLAHLGARELPTRQAEPTERPVQRRLPLLSGVDVAAELDDGGRRPGPVVRVRHLEEHRPADLVLVRDLGGAAAAEHGEEVGLVAVLGGFEEAVGVGAVDEIRAGQVVRGGGGGARWHV